MMLAVVFKENHRFIRCGLVSYCVYLYTAGNRMNTAWRLSAPLTSDFSLKAASNPFPYGRQVVLKFDIIRPVQIPVHKTCVIPYKPEKSTKQSLYPPFVPSATAEPRTAEEKTKDRNKSKEEINGEKTRCSNRLVMIPRPRVGNLAIFGVSARTWCLT